MKTVLLLVVICLLIPLPAAARESTFQDPLLDRMTGGWILQGTIAGAETTHDIGIEWVLGHQYLRIREVSREKTGEGAPVYEAIVFIGWDEPTGRYACLWLDCTGGGGLSPGAIGYAEPAGDELAFIFDAGGGSLWHTTFEYDRDGDYWRWMMDSETGGERQAFARVTLKRNRSSE